ncbi:MAG: cysteine peptidase family C39 domain-containing protein [bacterium]|nr:cysteine peptidase family C39 domain-containing protein [bacterium]
MIEPTKANPEETTTIPLRKLRAAQQKHASTCGPAALRTLLSSFGISKTERSLSRLCRTSARYGTNPNDIIAGLKKLGFVTKTGMWGGKEKCWRNINYWINKRGLPVLVDWFSGTDGHYSVAVRIDRRCIWIADPAIYRKKERIRKIDWNDFFRMWFDFEGDYLQRLKDLNPRWWLVAYPAPLLKNKLRKIRKKIYKK